MTVASVINTPNCFSGSASPLSPDLSASSMSDGSWSWKLAMSPASCTIDFDMPATCFWPSPTVLNMFP